MPLFGALMGLFFLSGAASAALPQAVTAPGIPPFATEIVLTGYNAVEGQTDSDPLVTASGSYANPEVVAARSRDLAQDLPFGTIIEIDGTNADGTYCGYDAVSPLIGYRVIADTMNARIKNHIDVLFHEHSKVQFEKRQVNPANALGACTNVSIKVVGFVDITRASHLPKTQAELLTILNKAELALK